jgi:hypothetical protein
MKTARTLLGLGLASFAAAALAHPGHDAPAVHAHDSSEAAWMIAIIVVAALGVAGLVKLRGARAKKARVQGDLTCPRI